MSELNKISDNYVVASRTDYQLEKFVVGRHDTPEMQYRQILLEAQSLIYSIKDTELTMQKTLLEIEELEASGSKIDAIEAERKRIGMALTDLTLQGAKRELAFLDSLFRKYPKYTPEQIEENQEAYWQKRLQKQADLDRASIETAIGKDNLQSMLDVGMVQQETNHLEVNK